MRERRNSEEASPVVSIRMTRPQRDEIDKAAKKAGVSRAAFIRRGIGLAIGMANYTERTITQEMIQEEITRLEGEL